MKVVLRDPQAEGAVEVWTLGLKEDVQLVWITGQSMHDLATDLTEDGASEPNYDEVSSTVSDLLIEAGLTKNPNHLRSAVWRFINPGPAYDGDEAFSWEA